QFDLERVDPLAGNLDQIVGAAAEEIKSVGVADEAIAGVDPSLLADGLGRLVGPVPVERRVGIAAHPQDAFDVVTDFVAVAIPESDFIAGDAKAGRAKLRLSHSVGEINV